MEMNDLINRLQEEVGEPSKNLTKEDALAMVSSFVKDIRKKFPSMADRKAILKTALKTLQFYVDEVDDDFDFTGGEETGEFDVGEESEENGEGEDNNNDEDDKDKDDYEFFDRILRDKDED